MSWDQYLPKTKFFFTNSWFIAFNFVLIAAAFCMYNRYVDGLGTWAPQEKESFKDMGRDLAEKGYKG